MNVSYTFIYWTQIGAKTHEFGHALGLHHQMTRADRDDYVVIDEDNIIESAKSNFEIETIMTAKTYGTPYDFGSVMHYSPRVSSTN